VREKKMLVSGTWWSLKKNRAFFLGPGVRFVFFSHTPSEKERTPKKKKKKRKQKKKKRKNGPR
jgi:hypothetical protein